MLIATIVHEFGIAAKDLWDLIGDFGNMGKWSGRGPGSCVQEGEGIGSLRTITLPNDQEIVDRLEACNDLSYTYSIVTSLSPSLRIGPPCQSLPSRPARACIATASASWRRRSPEGSD